jgi:hypothetical protein
VTAPVTAPPAPPGPGHKPHPGLVVAAVVLVVLVIGAGAAHLLAQAAAGTYERTNTIVPRSDRFTVDSDSGDVTLSPSPDGNVHVHTVVRYGLGEPELVQESTAAGIRLDSRCSGVLATRCQTDYDIEVPASFAVTINGTSGDVTATALTGPLKVSRLSGDTTLHDLTGPIDVTSRSGDVRGDGLRSATIRAATMSGDLRLELVTVPRSVDLGAENGDLDLAVPGDVAYRTQVNTRSGDESVTVPVDPSSSNTITLQTIHGDVVVHAVG